MVAQSVCVASAKGHIRPFSLRRDLNDLADLIEVAFCDELAATGSHMVQEMREMAALGPFLHLVQFLAPPMHGYVWVQGNRVVGNVTLAHEGAGRWTISNVAVLPEMRGQGIAGHLVDTAIAHVRAHKGRLITLQVRQDNAIAQALYAHRGFAVYDTVHELRLSPPNWPLVLRASSGGIRPLARTDGPWLPELIRASLPESARPYCPELGEAPPRATLWQRIRRELMTTPLLSDRIGMVALVGERPVGLATATVRPLSRFYKIQLYVEPGQRGVLERNLLEALLAQLDTTPRREIRTTLSVTHPEGLEALQRIGFESQRVLQQMGYIL